MNTTEATIKKTAAKLLLQYGLYGTSVSKIIKEANVTNGSFYHFFENLESLVNAIYHDFGYERVLNSYEAFFTGKTIKDSLYNMYKADLTWARSNIEKFNFIQKFTYTSLVSNALSTFDNQYFKPIEAAIEAAIANNELQSIDTEEHNMRLEAATDVAIMYSSKHPELDFEKYIEHSFNSYWRSIS